MDFKHSHVGIPGFLFMGEACVMERAPVSWIKKADCIKEENK